MKRTLITFLSFILATPAFAMIAGNVFLDDNEPAQFANIALADAAGNPIPGKGTSVDANGHFEISDDAPNIIITYLGYKDKSISTSTDLTHIVLEENATEINPVDVSGRRTQLGDPCQFYDPNNGGLRSGEYANSGIKETAFACKPKCEYTTYVATKLTSTTCPDSESGEKYPCKYFECVFDKNQDRAGKPCTPQELAKLAPHAKSGTVNGTITTTNEATACIITECENGWSPNLNGTQCIEKNCACGTEWDDETRTCVKWETDSCTAWNAVETQRTCDNQNEICVIKECADNYRLNKDKNVCISVNGMPCDKDIFDDANAELATYDENGKCIVRSCKPGFDMNTTTGQCVAREKADIDALQKNADAAKANEQSLKNKMKGAVGMGATGIGGMMIGSGLAEQFADDDAYADMRAYIDTFRCEYGSGQIAYGGDTNVDLPGGNELTDLYVQYTTLANDLKIRKQALNIRPGIESEVVIDKADSGLYDNAGDGITSGGYASVARAILNPGGSDSEKLETQNNNSADKLETGTGLAGAGIVGSILINNSQK